MGGMYNNQRKLKSFREKALILLNIKVRGHAIFLSFLKSLRMCAAHKSSSTPDLQRSGFVISLVFPAKPLSVTDNCTSQQIERTSYDFDSKSTSCVYTVKLSSSWTNSFAAAKRPGRKMSSHDVAGISRKTEKNLGKSPNQSGSSKGTLGPLSFRLAWFQSDVIHRAKIVAGSGVVAMTTVSMELMFIVTVHYWSVFPGVNEVRGTVKETSLSTMVNRKLS